MAVDIAWKYAKQSPETAGLMHPESVHPLGKGFCVGLLSDQGIAKSRSQAQAAALLAKAVPYVYARVHAAAKTSPP